MTTKTPLVSGGEARIPAIGLGTWQLAGDEGERAVRDALELGYRHIDTAAMYGNEAEVGRAIAGSGLKRDDIFLTTKVWHTDLAPAALLDSARRSLEKLKLERVDLLLIHWPTTTGVALADSIGALNEARRQGLARHIGVSNFPAAMLAEAATLSASPLAANQCEYHPRLDQTTLLAACRARGVAFTSYSPLGKGDLVADPTVAAMAAARGKSSSQIILRWHVQQGVVAIPRSRSRAHIAANFDVFDFELSEAEMARLSALARADGRSVNPGWAPAWDKPAR